VRVAGTNVDITERKEMERLKNEFIATVSHELRTPLTAIIGALGLLKKKAATDLPPDAAMFLSMAQQNSEQLAKLINDVLDLEKIESGLTAFHDEAVAVGPLLERAAALNMPYADKFDVRLELGQPLPDATVSGDADRLLQVMANLISNAVKFSPAGAVVAVTAEVRDGAARVAVADAGPGVPEEFRGRIFEKFAQADGSDTRRKGGTGLGLSICRAIVERMGGTIGYESAPGRGTVFYFDLPLRP
jgi:signal transduction histidine kinase